MREIICVRCNKKIEGFNINHADSLFQQHLIYCRKNKKLKVEASKPTKTKAESPNIQNREVKK